MSLAAYGDGHTLSNYGNPHLSLLIGRLVQSPRFVKKCFKYANLSSDYNYPIIGAWRKVVTFIFFIFYLLSNSHVEL